MMIGPILATRGLHNDCLMFCKAKRQQCIILKNIQVKYGQLLGRAINYDKSAIFFSRNVGNSTKEELSDIVGTTSPLNTGRYMGLSSLIGRDKKAILMYIHDRLWDKFNGWRNKKVLRRERRS